MTETGTETDSRDGMAPRSGGCPGFARRPPERRRHRERRAVDQRDGYARTGQPRLPERAVACMDAGSAAVRALGPEMTQRMCSEANPNREGAKHLYDLILNRHRSSSFVITSNRAVDEWLSLFDDPSSATAHLIGWPTPATRLSSRAPATGNGCRHTAPCRVPNEVIDRPTIT